MAMIIMSQQTVMFVRHTYDHIIYDTDQYSLNVGLMAVMLSLGLGLGLGLRPENAGLGLGLGLETSGLVNITEP